MKKLIVVLIISSLIFSGCSAFMQQAPEFSEKYNNLHVNCTESKLLPAKDVLIGVALAVGGLSTAIVGAERENGPMTDVGFSSMVVSVPFFGFASSGFKKARECRQFKHKMNFNYK